MLRELAMCRAALLRDAATQFFEDAPAAQSGVEMLDRLLCLRAADVSRADEQQMQGSWFRVCWL
jgi:hypothetical protein